MSGSLVAREELRAGLTRVLSDVPVRSGHIEAGATWTPSDGATAYVEAVLRPVTNLGVFAGATWSQALGSRLMAGARYSFRW